MTSRSSAGRPAPARTMRNAQHTGDETGAGPLHGSAQTRWLPLLLTAAVMIAFAASRIAILGFAWDRGYDEGVYLLSARSMMSGHKLFSAVFSSQPPAFLETLALTLRVAGDTLETARLMILGFSLLALAAIADLARRLAGGWAAPTAAAALALGETFFHLGRLVEAETPAIAVALVSAVACLHARERGWHRGWLLASGALFALASLYKLMVLPLAAPLGLLLLLAPARQDPMRWNLDGRGLVLLRRAAGRACIVAAGALAIGCVPLFVYDRRALYEQTIAFHLAKYRVYELRHMSNLVRVVHQLVNDAAITLTAVVGVVLLLGRERLVGLWLLSWFALMLVVVVQQSPLFWRHVVLLSPSVALAAGSVPALLSRAWPRPARLALTLAAIALWAAPALSVNASGVWVRSDPRPPAAISRSLQQTVAWILEHTAADELVVGDDPMSIYLAGRQAPPALCDTSMARIRSKSLELKEATQHSAAARVVVLKKGGRLSNLGGYVGWLLNHYELQPRSETGLGPSHRIWMRKTVAPSGDAVSPPE